MSPDNRRRIFIAPYIRRLVSDLIIYVNEHPGIYARINRRAARFDMVIPGFRVRKDRIPPNIDTTTHNVTFPKPICTIGPGTSTPQSGLQMGYAAGINKHSNGMARNDRVG